jgi:hypothetical protein
MGIEVFIPCLGKAVILAGWVAAYAPHAAPPACVVEPRGTVLMSSNIVPDLWRIDPATGSVDRLPIRLIDHANRDIGFTDLEMVNARGLRAKSAIDGSRWRIDLTTRTAAPER